MMWHLTQIMKLNSRVAINFFKNVWRLKNLLYLCGVKTMNVCRKRGGIQIRFRTVTWEGQGNPKT